MHTLFSSAKARAVYNPFLPVRLKKGDRIFAGSYRATLRNSELQSVPPFTPALYPNGRPETARLPRLGVLGQTRPGFWGPGGADSHPRPGAGRPRRQPDRPDVYGRSLRRLAIPGTVSDRFRLSAFQRVARGWVAIERRVYHRGSPLRPAR